MSERPEPHPDSYGDPDDWREQTTPGMTAVPTTAAPAHPYPHDPYGQQPYGQQSYGLDPYGQHPYGGTPGGATTPDYGARPVALRRPDALAALLLVLAGAAAGVSLLLHWVHGSTVTGWGLMRLARTQLGTGAGEIFRTGVWQPVAAVLGGAVLLVLGLLLFIPARTHRFLGVLALLVSFVAAAGVLVALSGAGWHVRRFDIGLWFAAAVPVLGLLGSLKALLTGPRPG